MSISCLLLDAMEDQERRFLEEKSHLFKDLDEQKSAFREVALKEARYLKSNYFDHSIAFTVTFPFLFQVGDG